MDREKLIALIAELGIRPHEIVRLRDARRVFGYAKTQRDLLIREGLLPQPIPLTDAPRKQAKGHTGRPSGVKRYPGTRGRGWLGLQIIEHHSRLLEAADREAAEREAKSRD